MIVKIILLLLAIVLAAPAADKTQYFAINQCHFGLSPKNICSSRLYIGMTKSKFSATSIVVSSIFVIHLVNGAQFLNATFVAWCPIVVIFVRLVICKIIF